MNITEKILSQRAGHEVTPGEIIEIPVDLAMSHDGTSPPAIKTFEKIAEKVWDPEKIALIFDHNVPANTIGSAEFQEVCRDFIKKQNITKNYIHGEGICHQVVPEMGLVEPNMVIVGADSHTCTYGAFGAFSTGMGATDLAMVWATGKTWFMVPEAIKMEIEGELNPSIAPKDIILNIIGDIGIAGATYKTAEFCGETIEKMGVEGRATMCNMAIEMGAKNGIMEPNREVIDYVCQRTGKKESELSIVKSDEDAIYSKEMHFDITDMEPQIACPNDVDNVKGISQVEGTFVNQCLIGSCTNGRLSDLKDAAELLEGNKIHNDTRLLIFPASREIYKQSIELGYIDTFIDAGAIICNPGCGPCLGAHMGVLSEGEACISTTNRNFKGRMGDTKSSVYLSNSKVVAASAIKGVITDPKDL
ncbi:MULTISPECIES: homoaconitase large subunit [Methanobrevibacter]|uniref:homoaconitase large subunit n=1 Tax=Methanobrevibacter TaxID=2172 RepID=UPI0025E489EA|nr:MULTISPECIES: homoaconitase large subunit [Methanobrevibacter]MBS7257801.1 3-isopropylmalate dehydratase large subunit [Methanobrevibacter sp.]MCI7428942.1 homoaconitase large subunit [Methanobrevibacter sp.]MDD6777311.1 homoaconitase large subunit [Methanobacteriaceae archaeon]MDY3097791.1 homoaconitase large subunit [Methanobrevibacter sp.]